MLCVYRSQEHGKQCNKLLHVVLCMAVPPLPLSSDCGVFLMALGIPENTSEAISIALEVANEITPTPVTPQIGPIEMAANDARQRPGRTK